LIDGDVVQKRNDRQSVCGQRDIAGINPRRKVVVGEGKMSR
jgi:hypothetical protein